MMQDELERTSRAARDVGVATPHQVDRTRARVLESMARRGRQRTPRAVGLAMAATLLLAGTAWAASAYGPNIALWIGGVVGAPSEGTLQARSTPGSPAATAPAVAPTSDPAIEPMSEPAPLISEPPSVPRPERAEAPSVRHPRPPASPSAPVEGPARPAAETFELKTAPDVEALYQEAHRLHFGARDPVGALKAWDRYLAVAPADVRAGLVLEARYNRAICLLRTGRREEAIAALRPFSEGQWGEYRQEDARALLREIDPIDLGDSK